MHSLINNSFTSGFITPVSRLLSFNASILSVRSLIISLSSANSENNASMVAKYTKQIRHKYQNKLQKALYQRDQFDIMLQLNCAQRWLLNYLLIEEFEQGRKQSFAQLPCYPCKRWQDLWLLASESKWSRQKIWNSGNQSKVIMICTYQYIIILTQVKHGINCFILHVREGLGKFCNKLWS